MPDLMYHRRNFKLPVVQLNGNEIYFNGDTNKIR